MRFSCASLLSVIPFLVVGLAVGEEHAPSNCRSWRGPLDTGVSPDATPPTTWSENSNIRWKVPIPGRGSGSPIVDGDRIFF